MKDEEMAMAKEYSKSACAWIEDREPLDEKDIQQAFLAGLKAGRTEWHKVADGDLPEVDNRIVLCVYGNGYIDGKRNYALKLLTRKEFPLFQPVYVWKEIVLPELPKESE